MVGQIKIIGARVYGGASPVDEGGHGSHTASTAAGRAVAVAGLAGGTARGAVPGARLAVYKVCHGGRCGEADILAAFDDGVDVISYSIGSTLPSPYFSDATAIGSFHAMRRGVVTSAAAGNFGRVTNVALWLLSVAASTIDRRSCLLDGLAGVSLRGKIVLCPKENFLNTGTGPFRAGAAGAVIVGDNPDTAFAVPLPALMVTQEQFDEIMAYVNSTSNPVGTIDNTETTTDPQAPIAASFSSPGPNLITPEILKPDISAPGVDIIAAWTPLSSPTGLPDDKRSVLYNIGSGASMACPHVTGAAAYVKSFHPDWSPAMIMSALITTASPMGADAGGELKHCAGQLNPLKARDPGLVYDATERDYVSMLCAQGYNATQLAVITGSNSTACAAAESGGGGGGFSVVADHNNPTMSAHVSPGERFSLSFPRTVTNVGANGAVVYNARIAAVRVPAAANLSVDVVPSRLEFSTRFRSVAFAVVEAADEVVSVAVVWSDGGEHEVRSPVVVYTVDVGTPEEGLS
uniref:Peptidase S8/S53 domain-containing protein n=1 Tax=Leersia perrieri TaxID=77586 RepID=A0A0D9WWE8_9ORYZ